LLKHCKCTPQIHCLYVHMSCGARSSSQASFTIDAAHDNCKHASFNRNQDAIAINQLQSINRNQSIAIKTIASMPPPSESRTPKINMFAHNPARPLALFSKGGGRGGRGPLVTRDLQRPKAYYHRPRTTLIYFEAFGGHPAGSKTICMRGGMSRYRSKTIHTRKQKRMHIRQLGVLAPSLLGLVQTLHGISIYRRFTITSKTI